VDSTPVRGGDWSQSSQQPGEAIIEGDEYTEIERQFPDVERFTHRIVPLDVEQAEYGLEAR
jgi:hypothetical protein